MRREVHEIQKSSSDDNQKTKIQDDSPSEVRGLLDSEQPLTEAEEEDRLFAWQKKKLEQMLGHRRILIPQRLDLAPPQEVIPICKGWIKL